MSLSLSLYIYIYICIYIYVYVYIYIYVYMYIQAAVVIDRLIIITNGSHVSRGCAGKRRAMRKANNSWEPLVMTRNPFMTIAALTPVCMCTHTYMHTYIYIYIYIHIYVYRERDIDR